MVNIGDPVKVSPLIKFFRYSFLIAGIFYGVSKKKALQILEDGRREDRERQKAERDAQLAAEKKAASEKDIQQIVSIFMPDEPRFRVEDQSFSKKEADQQPVNESSNSSCPVEEVKQNVEEEIDLSPLNDYKFDKSSSDCEGISKSEPIDDTNILIDNNDTEQDLSTYFVPEPNDVPFAAGESENFYPKDDDDDD